MRHDPDGTTRIRSNPRRFIQRTVDFLHLVQAIALGPFCHIKKARSRDRASVDRNAAVSVDKRRRSSCSCPFHTELIKYANQHDLDRQAEITEFLQPAVERTRQRLGRAIHVKFLLPYFAGAALSVATGNPLPLYLAYTGGMVSYLKDDAVTKEKEHALKIHKQSQRAANVETASLMDEMEQD